VGARSIDRYAQHGDAARLEDAEQLAHRLTIVVDMPQHVMCDHHVIAGIRQGNAGDIDAMRHARLMQVRSLVEWVVAHFTYDRLLRREMQNALPRQLVTTALGEPQMGQSVAFAAAALWAARVPSGRVSDTDQHAGLAAERASAGEPFPRKLTTITEPRTYQSADNNKVRRRFPVVRGSKDAATWRAKQPTSI